MNSLISCKLTIFFSTVKLTLGQKPFQFIHRLLVLFGLTGLDKLRVQYRWGAFGRAKSLRKNKRAKTPSKHSSWWRRLEDEYIHLSHTSLDNVFKTSWSWPIYSSWSCVFKTSSRRIIKLNCSWWQVFKTYSTSF